MFTILCWTLRRACTGGGPSSALLFLTLSRVSMVLVSVLSRMVVRYCSWAANISSVTELALEEMGVSVPAFFFTLILVSKAGMGGSCRSG